MPIIIQSISDPYPTFYLASPRPRGFIFSSYVSDPNRVCLRKDDDLYCSCDHCSVPFPGAF